MAVSVPTAHEELPAAYRLEPNYPNPFNPSTRIRFALPEPGHVLLRVFDVRGREVGRLVDRALPAGTHEAAWDGRGAGGRVLASGVYFYRLEARGFTATRPMVLAK